MTDQPRRQLSVLTAFLVVTAVLAVASLFVGTAGETEPAAPAPEALSVEETETTDAAPLPAPEVAPSDTTLASSAPSTSADLPPVATTRLDLHTPADIQAAITPKVAFITTFNGTGSGVLVSDNIIVTNAHVIWPFTTVGVLFPGDSRRAGTVVGIDARADVAFIEVESPRLPSPLRLGSTADLEDNDTLFVVGYPAADDFAPEPSVDVGPFEAMRSWEFSGASWVHSESAAIGGQSGGALVDEYGRLVGVTTFGGPSDLYSLSVEDVQQRLEALESGSLVNIDDRRPPRLGGRRVLALDFEGPWEQAAFVTWLSPGARSQLTSDSSVDWRALDPFGVELGAGRGSLDVFWGLATPGVVLAEARRAATADVEVSRPLVALDDPDDARALRAGTDLTGFVDVPGDRDWFYLEVAEADTTARIVVEAQTRVRIALYDRSSGEIVADVVHERGFFFEDPSLVVEDLAAGRYVVTVEDIGAQFGTYLITVE